jgi:probable F420-dependent oxidoreductase
MAKDNSRFWGFVSGNMPGDVLTAQARAMEGLGLGGIWAPQIYGPPWCALGACAAVTQRITLASGIALAFARSPFETAMAAMDLDRISGGRFVLGLGPSVRSWSEGFFGMPYGRPVEHLREVIHIVREVVAKSHKGELSSFQGKYHRHDWREFQPLATPVRPYIPIWVAAVRTPLVRLAGEMADGLIGHPIWSVRWAKEQALPALLDSLAKAGRQRADVHFNAWFWVVINRDRREAIEDAKGTVAFYAGIQQYEGYFAAHGFQAEARRCQRWVKEGNYAAGAQEVSDEMAQTFVICGDPDDVRRRLEPVFEFVDSLTLVPPIGGLPPEKVAAYAQAIAETFYL